MLSKIFITFIALLHFYILWIEMFAWETRGKAVFKNALKPEMFAPTKGLAANQGLYNGFLSAGLVWSLLINDPIWHINVATFFLGCIAVAGLYGAWTADKKILFIQTIPALLTIGLLHFFK
jgi:putative membrane protein